MTAKLVKNQGRKGKSCRFVCEDANKILALENHCAQLHKKMLRVQKMIRQVEQNCLQNDVWRALLNSSVAGMNEALHNLETRLTHIEDELCEVLTNKRCVR
jgi:hypothetical protein